MNLSSGLIKIKEYLPLLNTSEFKELEKFNDTFLLNYEKELGKYNAKWTNDSLHNWSRQYEYPYILQEIRKIIKEKGQKIRILDAGSGMTFFSYFLKNEYPEIEIICSDYDSILVDIYGDINKKSNLEVKFDLNDLRSMKYDAEYFDVIYCVSVLEHTNQYPLIIDNFKRILKPNGKLILTLDISLDNDRDIPVKDALTLFKKLEESFSALDFKPVDLNVELSNVQNLITTTYFEKYNPELLPWRSPYKNFIKSLLNLKKPKFIFNLVCYCGVFVKK